MIIAQNPDLKMCKYFLTDYEHGPKQGWQSGFSLQLDNYKPTVETTVQLPGIQAFFQLEHCVRQQHFSLLGNLREKRWHLLVKRIVYFSMDPVGSIIKAKSYVFLTILFYTFAALMFSWWNLSIVSSFNFDG